MAEDCLFCKIIAGEIPSTKVYEDDDVYAFEDINPVTPVHVLIVPKKHFKDITHANEEDENLVGKLLLRANKVAGDLGIAADGFRYVINTGAKGGQTIFHLHLHIMGGRAMPWPPS